MVANHQGLTQYWAPQHIFALNMVLTSTCRVAAALDIEPWLQSMLKPSIKPQVYFYLFIFLMQQHGYALHSKIMHFIRGNYLSSYHGMYACFTSHGTYSLTT